MRIIILGPPGSGKGTQARKLGEFFGIPQISTGKLFRDVVEQDSPLGKSIKSYLERGNLVPDPIVMDVIRERITREDCKKGFILDGFPRTLAQAEALTEILRGMNLRIDRVIDLCVPLEELLERLTGRRTCSRCEEGFHIRFSPPRKEGICDRCGGPLVGREDDREETIRNRFSVYKTQSERLKGYYGKVDCYVQVDGSKNMTSVAEAIGAALDG